MLISYGLMLVCLLAPTSNDHGGMMIIQVFPAVSAAVTFSLIVLRENAAGFKTKAGQGQVQLVFAFAIAVFLKVDQHRVTIADFAVSCRTPDGSTCRRS